MYVPIRKYQDADLHGRCLTHWLVVAGVADRISSGDTKEDETAPHYEGCGAGTRGLRIHARQAPMSLFRGVSSRTGHLYPPGDRSVFVSVQLAQKYFEHFDCHKNVNGN